jgi:hypothetical protein
MTDFHLKLTPPAGAAEAVMHAMNARDNRPPGAICGVEGDNVAFAEKIDEATCTRCREVSRHRPFAPVK